jgi:TolB protein
MMKQTILILGIGLGSAIALGGAKAAPPLDIVARPLPDDAQQQQQPPPQPQQPRELVLALDNPSYQPRIGIPDFIATGGDAELQAAAKLLADVLGFDLDFEKEFLVVDRKASAAIPVAATVDAIPWDSWRQIGADFVIFATVRRSGASFTVEMKVLRSRGEPVGEQKFGSEYANCAMNNPRYCAHFIADDMHLKLRNLTGVARTKLAFASDRDATRQAGRFEGASIGKEIYISDYDGANQRPATANRSLNINPTWLPDARGLAYASYVSKFPDIYVSLFDGRPPTRPAGGTDVIQNTLPAVSPDGTRIAFASTRDGNFDIYVMNRDGSNARRVTSNAAADTTPTWSPTGTQIAFTSDRLGVGAPEVFIMDADGLNQRQLTHEGYADRPTWSPSPYNEIAYTARTGAGNDIKIVDVSTREVRRLTFGEGTNESPAFAPNGRHIAFMSTRSGKSQIFTIARDGKDLKQLTRLGNNYQPNWSPR